MPDPQKRPPAQAASGKIAVFNNYHAVGVQVGAWMLKAMGYRVFVTGGSFCGRVHALGSPNCKWSHENSVEGVMEFAEMPPDALFLDAYPQSEAKLRAAGWRGPFLIYWGWPCGADWIEKGNFKPGPRVAALTFNRKVCQAIRERNLCPVDFSWRPYHMVVPIERRSGFENFLITVIQNAAGWSNVHVLSELRDHLETRLELYGGGPPDWSKQLPHKELLGRIAKAAAMFHLKPIDSPGNAWVEAVLSGVPLIVPRIFLERTGFDHILVDGETCLVATGTAEVLAAARKLSVPSENERIGTALRTRYLAEADWPIIREKVERLIAAIA